MTSPVSLYKPKRLRWLRIRRVTGLSMSPVLQPGTVVLATRPRRVSVGDIVIVEHDDLEKIKRVTAIRGRRLFLQGDNGIASTDSRHFGWVDRSTVVGVVRWPFAR